MFIDMESYFIENFIDFELSNIKVRVIKDFREIEFDEKKYGPFKKDTYIEIPRALARILASEQIIEYPMPSVSLMDLKKILFYETKNKELKKLDNDFYLQVKDLIYLAEIKKVEYDPKEIKNLMYDICLKRVEKIVQIALYVEDYKKLLDYLTTEEKYLLEKFNEFLKDWFDNVIDSKYLRRV
jgi:hypothetical protein